MENYKISIIIPAYNAQNYIERCIDSISNQTYKNYEIIVVNDGSTDNTQKILQQYEEDTNKLIVKTVPNGGVGTARNIGIELATGEFIMFIDSDDYLEHNCLEVLYNNQIKTEADIVCNNFYIVTEQGDKQKNNVIKPGIYNSINENFLYEYFFENIGSSVWGKLYRKSHIENQKFNKTKMGEDVFFNIRVLLNNPQLKINILDEPVYNYYKNYNSVTYKKIDNLIDSWKYEINTLDKKNYYIDYLLGMQLYRLYNEYVHNVSLCTNKNEYMDNFIMILFQDKDIIEFAKRSLKNKTYKMINNKIKRYIYIITIFLIKTKQKKLLKLITCLKLKYLIGDKG